jgi:hypothetical protein
VSNKNSSDDVAPLYGGFIVSGYMMMWHACMFREFLVVGGCYLEIEDE